MLISHRYLSFGCITAILETKTLRGLEVFPQGRINKKSPVTDYFSTCIVNVLWLSFPEDHPDPIV